MAYKEFLDETLSTVQEEDVQMAFSGFYEEKKQEITGKGFEISSNDIGNG